MITPTGMLRALALYACVQLSTADCSKNCGRKNRYNKKGICSECKAQWKPVYTKRYNLWTGQIDNPLLRCYFCGVAAARIKDTEWQQIRPDAEWVCPNVECSISYFRELGISQTRKHDEDEKRKKKFRNIFVDQGDFLKDMNEQSMKETSRRQDLSQPGSSLPSGDNMINRMTLPGAQPSVLNGRLNRQPSVVPTAPPMPRIPTPPEGLVCPITKELMRKPVTDVEGNTYEKEAITKYITEWFQKHDREGSPVISPVTGHPLKDIYWDPVTKGYTNLIENWNIKNNIEEYKKKHRLG